MKIRQSFVSNSSTSSYLIYGKIMTIDEFNSTIQKLGKQPVPFDGSISDYYYPPAKIGTRDFDCTTTDGGELLCGITLLRNYETCKPQDIIKAIWDLTYDIAAAGIGPFDDWHLHLFIDLQG